MASTFPITQYLQKDDHFYRDYYHYFLGGLIALFFVFLFSLGIVFYQIAHRPIPAFTAKEPGGQTVTLTPFQTPNLLPETLLRWASKATVTAYTFDFVNYNDELKAARNYFTEAGWDDFRAAINATLAAVIKNQLFITGVVSGAPVIVNQGPLPGKGYVWRIQIPFLVTYQSANTISTSSYVVILSVVHVPTTTNPQGIGIDQFVMANPYG